MKDLEMTRPSDTVALTLPGVATNALARRSEPERNAAAVYLARLAAGSRRAMLAALNNIAGVLTSGRDTAATLRWHDLRYQHTQAVRARLAESYAPATVNKMLAALRGVLRESWRLGLMESSDFQRAADLAAVKATTLPRGRALASGELRALFLNCAADKTAGGSRDAALLAVLYGAGLRRSEAAALDLADYDAETGALTIRSGKGHKARVAYATGGAETALAAWLQLRGDSAGALFCPVNKSGRVSVRRLSDQSVLCALRKRADLAGVGTFSPHDLRRTFISDLLDAGADISTVQRLAGHSNVQTTARYDRRGEVTKRKAAEMLHVPYGV